jgi:hypothetical protein
MGEKIMNLGDIISYNQEQVEHIQRVQKLVFNFCNQIMEAVLEHDSSKFSSLEYFTFVKSKDILNASVNGKDVNYQSMLNSEGIQKHITENSHHPEYWDTKNELMPIKEAIIMFFDWLSRSQQRKTDFNNFWIYNCDKLKDQPHALEIVKTLKREFVDKVDSK